MDTNVFKHCTWLKAIGSFMILVVLGIVAVTYYAVVIASYGPDLVGGGATSCIAFVVIFLFHLLLFMLLWCYFATVLTDPGEVPKDWSPYASQQYDLEAASEKHSAPASHPKAMNPITHEPEDEEGASASLIKESLKSDASSSGLRGPQQRERPGTPDRSGHGGGRGAAAMPSGDGSAPLVPRELSSSDVVDVRKCKKCLHYKPPRTHHCSVCQKCILKMDHHCVWVVNCVGAKNYKSFLLFMVYTCLESLLVSCSLLPRFIRVFADNLEGDVEEPGQLAAIFLSFVLNLAFALSLMGFLAMHVSLVSANTTTIEAFEKSKASSRWKYDMGRQRNIEQVFGRDKRYWLLPVYSKEDQRSMPELSGLDYPCKVLPDRQLREGNATMSLDLD